MMMRVERGVMQKTEEKKQILLRISPALFNELARWADDEFRSLNSQIEYLLTRTLKEKRRKIDEEG